MLGRKSYRNPASIRDYLRLFFTGFAMGTADTIPGVSGGTMAFILGVYEDLLLAIKSFNILSLSMALKIRIKELLELIPWRFLIALGTGILGAIFTLSGLLSSLLQNHPTYLFAFFGGLILASIVAIAAHVKWSTPAIIALIAGAVGAFILVGMNPHENVAHTPLALFLSGMIAITAMILPGISGSFILLILGQYEYVINAVRDRDFLVLLIFALGCIVGLAIASRILSYMLKRFYATTVVLLTGFMLGSLRVIWSSAQSGVHKIERFGLQEQLFTVGLILVGFFVVSLLDHLASGKNPIFLRFWQLDAQKAEISN
jgi:putative membrane protein